jgi:hypothetical protein
MRLPAQRSFLVFALGASLAWGAPSVLANPVMVGPPPMVDGKPVPMPTVKKWGQYWYPAALVGQCRGIEFAFDHATNTLYADGSVLEMDTLVVDDVVYIPIAPTLSMTDMRPGLAALQARRSKYEAEQAGMAEQQGNTDLLFMETTVDMPAHPWADAPAYVPTGPIIDLDATGVGSVPAHMSPAAMPAQAAPEHLPDHLPRATDIVPSVQTASYPAETGSGSGIPLRVTTHGGPQDSAAPADVARSAAAPPTSGNTQLSSSPVGLQPIPQAVAATRGATAPSSGSLALPPSRGKNQAFEVLVLEGSLKNSASDRLLSLKLNQKNLSPVAQANLGSFALRCQDGSRVEPVKSRSVMPEGTLAPGGVREGELLFRLSPGAQPAALELEGTLPLTVTLAP